MANIPTTFADEAQQDDQWFNDMARLRKGSQDMSDAARASRARMQAVDLEEECDMLREELSRSKALNRLALIQNQGLLQTVRHLRKAWSPIDPAESGLKEDMNPLLYGKIERVQNDPAEMQKIDDRIKRTIYPPKG